MTENLTIALQLLEDCTNKKGIHVKSVKVKDGLMCIDDLKYILGHNILGNHTYAFYSVIFYIINQVAYETEHKALVQEKLLTFIDIVIAVYHVNVMTAGGPSDDCGLAGNGLYKAKKAIQEMCVENSNPYVVHMPHCGINIPQKFLDDYYLDEETLKKNIHQYADFKTDNIYRDFLENFDSVINPYSRLFFDPERFFDDSKENMAIKHNLGWFYENAILEKTTLRSKKNKDEISTYYHKHHEHLTTLVEQKLENFGHCTIIDAHSFSNQRYWFHDKDIELPDICIGYDEFHKDEKLIKILLEVFKDYNVGINSPYSGSLVPTKYYHKDARVKSVMIEVNKKLYLDENHSLAWDKANEIAKKMSKVLEQI